MGTAIASPERGVTRTLPITRTMAVATEISWLPTFYMHTVPDLTAYIDFYLSPPAENGLTEPLHLHPALGLPITSESITQRQRSFQEHLFLNHTSCNATHQVSIWAEGPRHSLLGWQGPRFPYSIIRDLLALNHARCNATHQVGTRPRPGLLEWQGPRFPCSTIQGVAIKTKG